MLCDNTAVSVASCPAPRYPEPPYEPALAREEFSSLPFPVHPAGGEPGVYESVLQSWRLLGLDTIDGNGGWNPLRAFIEPGQHCVIKPNLVFDRHPLGAAGTLCTITHASVIRPVIDYLLLATNADVRITICDVPLQSADWDRMMQIGGYYELRRFYAEHGIEIRLLDLRREISMLNRNGLIVKRIVRERDPLGYTAVDLGSGSALQPIIEHYRRLRITDYRRGSIQAHHNPKRNEYLIASTILDADLFINMPKLKTHRKAGITCAMKNLIGINGDKSWIAHHRSGSPARNGDEYRRLQIVEYCKWHLWSALKASPLTLPLAAMIKHCYYRFIARGRTIEDMKFDGTFNDCMEGSWYGNDTVWRCIADLNHIILFADSHGRLLEQQARRYLCIVDGIIAGEGEGPMQNTPREAGVVLAGVNPLAVDHTAARLMGFSPRKIPSIHKVMPLSGLRYPAPVAGGNIDLRTDSGSLPNLGFTPVATWKGHIEQEEQC